MLFLLTFVIAFFLNLYVIIFGKKSVEQMRQKLSLKKYLSELNEGLDEIAGKGGAKFMRGAVVVLAISFVIFNALTFLLCLLAVFAATFAAKKSYQVSRVSNFLNKIATYISRIR